MLELITVDFLYQFLTISIFGQFKSMNALKSLTQIYISRVLKIALVYRDSMLPVFFLRSNIYTSIDK